MPFDWRRLYGDATPQRVSLPTYPFAKDRYWLAAAPQTGTSAGGTVGGTERLHPLLHRNSSDLDQQRYSSTFDGGEYFLADHVMQGRRLLPGVAQVEMAHEAVLRALGDHAGAQVELRDIVFARPVAVAGPLELHIGLQREADASVTYEIYSRQGDTILLHGQGRARPVQAAAARIDLHALQAGCTQVRSGPAIYERLDRVGMHYGPAMRALQEIRSGADVAVGRLVLPREAALDADRYRLNPSLVDGSLLASIGLLDDAVDGERAALPFAIERVLVRRALPREVYAVVRANAGGTAQVRKLDIVICDEQGEVCAELTGFSSRVLDAAPTPDVSTLLYEPVWVDQAADPQPAASAMEHWVLLCEAHDKQAEIETCIPGVRCVRLGNGGTPLAQRYGECAAHLLDLLKQILLSKPQGEVMLQLVAGAEGQSAALGGLSGMLKSAAQENGKLRVQVLYMQPADHAVLASRLEEQLGSQAQDIRYVCGSRQVLTLVETQASANPGQPWKDGGVYLITGGTGGLGLIFATQIARTVTRPTLVLTARSAPSVEQRRRLDELADLGAQVEFRQVDVSDRLQVQALVDAIGRQYGCLNGIVHSAGVLRDGFIVNKTAADLAQVLAPKVDGVLNLDEASRDMALDCFILFSSTSGVMGNVGQSDYAAANGFMDAYAAYRNNLVAQGQRHGASLSMNWPLWADGGMRIDDATLARLWRGAGLAPMHTTDGVAALAQGWSKGLTQCVVLAGDAARIRAGLAPVVKVADRVPQIKAAPVAADLREQVESLLVDEVAALLKIPRAEIELDVPWSEFGFDSITLTIFGNGLNERHGLELSPTVFFEYATLARLAGHLLAEHDAPLRARLSAPQSASKPAPVGRDADPAAVPARRAGRQPAPAAVVVIQESAPEASPGPQGLDEPIAVIGISCSFPQSPDPAALWDNLRNERDCVGAIPEGRWAQAMPDSARHAGVIDDMTHFDPLFFGISPREAEGMDPQQRLLMTHVWKVIEDAAYAPASLAGTNTALFIGTGNSGYGAQCLSSGMEVEGHSAAGAAASIGPNRMSYLLDLHGPSEPIETACSSALVAVHRAMLSFRAGECEMAIVGGVNTLVSPEAHQSFAKAGMLSADGRCRTFSAEANGYVRAEGVGMLMLKRLSAAERDGDHIYGVLLGSAQNHGGKASSLTAPNPRAQADLIKAAMTQAGVDPRSVNYIEAHGTGTPLGDPIEVNGLKSAFHELSGGALDTAYCGLGSIKSNIGHAEMAAGAAGLIKVLLQMRHRTLVKSLHSEQTNPHIALDGSPFYIVKQTGEWPALRAADGQALPRRAGVSSFGFGGVNAHVIVQEYVPPVSAVVPTGPWLLVLSAKDPERLGERAAQLLGVLRDGTVSGAQLADLAYTLQVGREAMAERAAFVFDTLPMLLAQLAAYADGRRDMALAYFGRQRRGATSRQAAGAEGGAQSPGEGWGAERLGEIAAAWVGGTAFDWAMLYGEQRPRRMSLPSYPFAQESYWMRQSGAAQGEARPAAVLHPLLHANTSSVRELRFSSTFTGREFYLRDHVVRGRPVMPGVALLEMAREAFARVADQPGLALLSDVAFLRPVVVEAELCLHVALRAETGSLMTFQIYSQHDGDKPVIHCEGRASMTTPADSEPLDLLAWQAVCGRDVPVSTCYGQFQDMGLAYGPAMRALQAVASGSDGQGGTVVLARLALPSEAAHGSERYQLHPSLLDASLQASIALAQGADGIGEAALPFAIESVLARRALPAKAFALVRTNPGSGKRVRKLDVVICDEYGDVCAEMRGFSTRVVDAAPVARVGTVLMQPAWSARALPAALGAPYAGRHVVLLCALDGVDADALQRELPDARCIGLRGDGSIAQLYEQAALRILDEAKALLHDRSHTPALLQVVVPALGPGALLEGLSGLLRSAGLEHVDLRAQLLAFDEAHAPTLPATLLAAAASAEKHLRYKEGECVAPGWAELTAQAPLRPWKDGGVYLIAGGIGGLGLIFAEEIARQVKNPTLVLTARSPLTAAQRGRLQGLVGLGARVEFKQVDLSHADQVRALIAAIGTECGALHGILHCAGVLRDGLMIRKRGADLTQVLAPKVAGLVNLDEASRKCELDCFVLFSSISAALGNVGQADYAAANGFMDAYASYRNALAAGGQRHGRTLSVNWPLWAEGGMRVDAATRAALWQGMGMHPMGNAAGIAALYQAWASGSDQVLVVEGDGAAIRHALSGAPAPSLPVARADAAAPDDDAFYRSCLNQVRDSGMSETQFLNLLTNQQE
ncbi:MAG: SDR family NAD(P)-dependent oxidoreductase [Pseudomonadota bacterium]